MTLDSTLTSKPLWTLFTSRVKYIAPYCPFRSSDTDVDISFHTRPAMLQPPPCCFMQPPVTPTPKRHLQLVSFTGALSCDKNGAYFHSGYPENSPLSIYVPNIPWNAQETLAEVRAEDPMNSFPHLSGLFDICLANSPFS